MDHVYPQRTVKAFYCKLESKLGPILDVFDFDFHFFLMECRMLRWQLYNQSTCILTTFSFTYFAKLTYHMVIKFGSNPDELEEGEIFIFQVFFPESKSSNSYKRNQNHLQRQQRKKRPCIQGLTRRSGFHMGADEIFAGRRRRFPIQSQFYVL